MQQICNNPLIVQPVRPLPGRVAVIGAGTIGPDIGYYLKGAIADLELVLIDLSQDALDRASARIRSYADKGLAKGKLTADAAARTTARITTSTDYAAIRGSDWVIEAATENLPVKRAIFTEVESLVAADALITSNTSSLPAARLFSHLRHPERATVTHFFAPAFRNPIVEVIDWPVLDRERLQHLRWLFATTGKVPLVAADAVCFMLDRIFDNWCNEAGHLLADATAEEIDSAAQEFVAAGPFFVLNLANGNPIIVETNDLQAEVEGQHYRPAAVFRSVERWKTVPPGRRVEVPAAKLALIRDRLLGILFSQSLDILDRRIGTAADLELGSRLAFGFKSGPLELMQAEPASEVARILQRLRHERAGMPGPAEPLQHYQRFRRHVLVDDLEGVKVLTVRRPEALNALHEGLNDELLDAIREFEDDPATRGFVITGYGHRAFCAGADIGRFPSMLGDAAAAREYARACSRLLVHIDAMRKPVVAALNGMALGGGLELAIRCHGLVGVREAWLQFPEITLGIVPGIGAMVVPYRRWPQACQVFHGMLREAEKLTAERAHALGIVAEVVDTQFELIPAALRLLRHLAQSEYRTRDAPVTLAPLPAIDGGEPGRLSREVRAIMDRAIVAAAASSRWSQALEVGYEAFGASACTAAAREGIAAFSERRRADFSRTG
jgi:enoyl-CoA hydratase / 3-hydroxyacyl-CoA dehydrogenase